MERKKLKSILFLSAALLAQPSSAKHNLTSVYKMAAQNDPVIQAARHNWLATKQQVPQSLAQLLPTFSAKLSSFKRDYDLNIENTVSNAITYQSRGYAFNLYQPIFDFSKFMNLSQSKANVKAATMRYFDAEQNLIYRTAVSYINVLKARAALRYAVAQRRVAKNQLDYVNKRHEMNVDSLLPSTNAKAFYINTQLAVIDAQNKLINRRSELIALTNSDLKNIADVYKVKLLLPKPTKKAFWVHKSFENNLIVQANQHARDAAKLNISRISAGHLPVLNLVGSINYSHANKTVSLFSNNDTESRDRSIGLELNIPIYQGGLVVSQTKQAQEEYLKACAELTNSLRQARLSTAIAYDNIIYSVKRVRTNYQRVQAMYRAYDVSYKSFKVNKLNIINLNQVMQDLYVAKNNYAQSRYDYILNWLELKRATGTLTKLEVAQIDKWLQKV